MPAASGSIITLTDKPFMGAVVQSTSGSGSLTEQGKLLSVTQPHLNTYDTYIVVCLLYPAAYVLLTVLSAFNVVSSLEAAKHPSSVEPPSHIPAKAAMLL